MDIVEASCAILEGVGEVCYGDAGGFGLVDEGGHREEWWG